MNITSQRVGIYCGYAFFAAVMLGFMGIAGFFPPPSPIESAQQIQQRFQDDALRIRFGMLVCLFGSALVLWWWGTVITQVKRIEGRHSPITYLQLAGACAFAIEFLYPFMFWAVAAFRPDDSAELVRKFNDLAWLPFLGIVSTAAVQCAGLAVVILRDTRQQPVYPRWVAYLNIWAAVLFVPADLIIFFKNGPLAWNGAISFYLVLTVFGIWFVAMTVMTNKAITAQAGRPEAEPPDNRELAAEIATLTAALAVVNTKVDGLCTGPAAGDTRPAPAPSGV